MNTSWRKFLFVALYCLATAWLDETLNDVISEFKYKFYKHLGSSNWRWSPNLTRSSKLAAAPNWLFVGNVCQSPTPKPLGHKGTWTTQSHTLGSFVTPEMCSERDSPLKLAPLPANPRETGSPGMLRAACLSRWLQALASSRSRSVACVTGRDIFRWPRRAKCGRPITHQWIDPWTLLLPGQHRWAQVGATGEPHEFR